MVWAMLMRFCISVVKMTYQGIVLCFCVLRFVASEPDVLTFDVLPKVREFPDGFLFGVASAAYQVEGAWNEDGKSESIWDRDTHQTPSPIKENATGDVADDSYHQYKSDVQMLRELGVDFYRFSLAWTRILPTGFPNQINQAGVDYYNNLINELLKYNIKPVVTLFHWDMPARLQDLGGWATPHIVDWIGDYARVAFELFGDRVKHWITVNEPVQICYFGYDLDIFAPRLNFSGVGQYICGKHLLLGHARIYHIYDEDFRASQGGTIFITLSSTWAEPESEKDHTAARDEIMWTLGLYAHPIFFKKGGWPPMLKERIDRKSAELGFFSSRLPDFTLEEVEYIRGTSDIFGLNHYTSVRVSSNRTLISKFGVPSLRDDMGVYAYQLDEWKLNNFTFFKYMPSGFYKLLSHIREEYDNPSVFIVENGYGSYNDRLHDDDRIKFLRTYLSAMLDAIDEGSKVIGYTVWCLMDNFEWTMGYSVKFGLYHVDMTSPMRTRTPRKSAFAYKEIIRSRALDYAFQPTTPIKTINETFAVPGVSYNVANNIP